MDATGAGRTLRHCRPRQARRALADGRSTAIWNHLLRDSQQRILPGPHGTSELSKLPRVRLRLSSPHLDIFCRYAGRSSKSPESDS